MIKIALFATLLAMTTAQQRNQPEVTVISDTRENNGDGTFRWAFETSDGTRQEQSGYIKNPGAPQDETIQSISGSFSHYSPEGQLVSVTYTADENGFQPLGDHLPTSPPIPEAIQKALDIIYRNAGLQQQRVSRQQPKAVPRQQPYRPQPPRF